MHQWQVVIAYILVKEIQPSLAPKNVPLLQHVYMYCYVILSFSVVTDPPAGASNCSTKWSHLHHSSWKQRFQLCGSVSVRHSSCHHCRHGKLAWLCLQFIVQLKKLTRNWIWQFGIYCISYLPTQNLLKFSALIAHSTCSSKEPLRILSLLPLAMNNKLLVHQEHKH